MDSSGYYIAKTVGTPESSPVTIAAVGEAQPSFEYVVNRLRVKFTWRIWRDDISETLDDSHIRLTEGW